MSSRKFSYWLLTIVYGLLTSCSHDRLKVDVSHIKVESVKIERFDQDFFALNADNIVSKLPELQKKYYGFTELYVRNIICANGIQDSSCIPEITRFVNDKDVRDVFNGSQKNFINLIAVESELTEAFRHHQYYFAEKKLPKVLAA